MGGRKKKLSVERIGKNEDEVEERQGHRPVCQRIWIGNWVITQVQLNPGSGVLFEGPTGRRFYIAPRADPRQSRGKLNSLPRYVREGFLKLVRKGRLASLPEGVEID